MYRVRNGAIEVLLIHPGGPYWNRKDAGGWSIPKGEYDDDEEPLAAAKREFLEETGCTHGEPLIELRSVRQAGGKTVRAWAFEGDCDPLLVVSNTFEIEWPPRVRPDADVSRGGQGGVVRPAGSQTENQQRSGTAAG
jgi:predicted NUDIX family NTP pyrophosphohydrolase